MNAADFNKLERDFTETRKQNEELQGYIESQKEVIQRKTAEFEELKAEIESITAQIERYEKEITIKLKEERAEYNIKSKKMQTENTRLICEIEDQHQKIKILEAEKVIMKRNIVDLEQQSRQ